MSERSLRLLSAFSALFDGKQYRHRSSKLGDQVSVELYEDLYALGRSAKLVASVDARKSGVGPANKTVTLAAMRRGDGTFGALVDPSTARAFPGYQVARGAIATIDAGTEMKVLNKAMIKQIDRVVNDLEKQVRQWQRISSDVVSLAVVGINHAAHTTGYEDDRAFPTDGKKHKHPIQEAPTAEQRIRARVVEPRIYDEVLILRYRATNVPPYPFEWVDRAESEQAYRAALIRLSDLIERRT
jgi:hypothetical protein